MLIAISTISGVSYQGQILNFRAGRGSRGGMWRCFARSGRFIDIARRLDGCLGQQGGGTCNLAAREAILLNAKRSSVYHFNSSFSAVEASAPRLLYGFEHIHSLPLNLQSNFMPPIIVSPRALRSSGSLLRAGFSTSKPRCRALQPGPRGTVRRPPHLTPLSKRPSKRSPSPSDIPRKPPDPPNPPQEQQSSLNAVSKALRESDCNNLLSAVHIPHDPNGVLTPDHPATSILSNSAIVVTRQLELMNVILGFEQANKYVIMDPQGNHIGYMAERELGMGNMMARQMFSTHRSFTTHVFDKHGKEVLRVSRLSGRIRALRADTLLVSQAFRLDIQSDRCLRSCRGWKACILLAYGGIESQFWRPDHRGELRDRPDLITCFIRHANHRRGTTAVGISKEKVQPLPLPQRTTTCPETGEPAESASKPAAFQRTSYGYDSLQQ